MFWTDASLADWGFKLKIYAAPTSKSKAFAVDCDPASSASCRTVTVSSPGTSYETNTIYNSSNIKFPNAGAYLLRFTTTSATERRRDFLRIYAGNSSGALLYSRSGGIGVWTEAIVNT